MLANAESRLNRELTEYFRLGAQAMVGARQDCRRTVNFVPSSGRR